MKGTVTMGDLSIRWYYEDQADPEGTPFKSIEIIEPMGNGDIEINTEDSDGSIAIVLPRDIWNKITGRNLS